MQAPLANEPQEPDVPALSAQAVAAARRIFGAQLFALGGGLALVLASLGFLLGAGWQRADGGWLPIVLLGLAAAGLLLGALRVARTALDSALAGLARRQAAILNAKDDELASLRGAKDALAQMMVHDLRSPLGSVILFLDLIHGALEGAGLGKDAESALLARGEAVRLNEMLGDLLLISRLEQVPTFAQSETGLRALLEEVHETNAARTTAAGVAVELEVDPRTRAMVDQRLVRRALENLLANALRRVKAGDKVGITASADEREVVFTVSHTGAPVPEKLRAALVERATLRGERRAWRGSGFGLYLCNLVAQAHGGTFGLAERAGWSVTFEMRLPVRAAAAAASKE